MGAAEQTFPIEQDKFFMREAIKQANQAGEADEVPIGAVIVHENRIIGKAHNQVQMLKDPTAHAEMIAITQAANYLSKKFLHNCSLYVTIEPCSMCAGALILARIDRIIFGATDPKTGACGSIFDIAASGKLNHKIQVFQGLLGDECAGIITSFFQKKREIKNKG